MLYSPPLFKNNASNIFDSKLQNLSVGYPGMQNFSGNFGGKIEDESPNG